MKGKLIFFRSVETRRFNGKNDFLVPDKITRFTVETKNLFSTLFSKSVSARNNQNKKQIYK